jgi:hypothetical protein
MALFMPQIKLIVTEESLVNYLIEKGVSPQFFTLYIKDKAEPLDVLAQILATHRFENDHAAN